MMLFRKIWSLFFGAELSKHRLCWYNYFYIYFYKQCSKSFLCMNRYTPNPIHMGEQVLYSSSFYH